MKTILVLTGGSETDTAVFDTALAAAKPFAAHLVFLHVRVSAGQAAAFTPHVDFARGAALHAALEELQAEAARRSAAAARHFQGFCQRESIEIAERPSPSLGLSASWCEEEEDAVSRILRHARYNDLIVLARASRSNGLPRDLLPQLLLACGRPLLITARRAPQMLTGTVLLCWQETATTARALGAALPLLSKSRRVIVLGVEGSAGPSPSDLRELGEMLAWHGISAECKWEPSNGRPTELQLDAAAGRYEADLVVMGGYGHSRARELVFGGCTQHFLDQSERPLFIMH